MQQPAVVECISRIIHIRTNSNQLFRTRFLPKGTYIVDVDT
jgi:hypothetical protein